MKPASRFDVEVWPRLVQFDVYCVMFIAIVSLVMLQTSNATQPISVNMFVCLLTMKLKKLGDMEVLVQPAPKIWLCNDLSHCAGMVTIGSCFPTIAHYC